MRRPSMSSRRPARRSSPRCERRIATPTTRARAWDLPGCACRPTTSSSTGQNSRQQRRRRMAVRSWRPSLLTCVASLRARKSLLPRPRGPPQCSPRRSPRLTQMLVLSSLQHPGTKHLLQRPPHEAPETPSPFVTSAAPQVSDQKPASEASGGAERLSGYDPPAGDTASRFQGACGEVFPSCSTACGQPGG